MSTATYAPKKTVCPISREQFASAARSMQAVMRQPATGDKTAIEDTVTLPVKQFSTGSFGWYASGKITVYVDGKPVQCQLGINLTVVGSKELPQS